MSKLVQLGKGVRVQMETRGPVLLFPEGIVDLNKTAYTVLSKLPSTRQDLRSKLEEEFKTRHLEGLDPFLEESLHDKWVVEKEVS